MSRAKTPEPLQSDYPTPTLIRKEIWERLHKRNEHYQAGVFGREGKGKSGTALSICETVDPNFNIDQVMFDPGSMLRRINEWKQDGSTKGRMIVADEAGVGLGNRTWYEEDQIRFAQVLQLIRSENMGILFTVPRGSEMDSQVRGGRLHAQMLVKRKMEGDFVEIEYESIEVGRRIDADGMYTPKVEMEIDGVERRIKTIRIGPPSDEIWEPYEEKKNQFQSEQYEEAADQMTDEESDEINEIKDLANDILDGDLESVVSIHGQNGNPYVDKELIRALHNVSHADANAVRSLIQKQVDDEELQKYA